VLEKAVELGAHRIVPLRTERGVVAARPGRESRWRTLLVSALKQSGRALLPELAPAADLAALLAEEPGGPLLFGAVPGEAAAVAWTELLAPAPRPLPPTLTLLVGPEGGWTPAERAAMAAHGARAVGLGPHVLRTETAAVAGLAALQALRQAWRRTGEA
jgi:16S rRNA (uracil1498-N3)-methyltransferase